MRKPVRKIGKAAKKPAAKPKSKIVAAVGASATVTTNDRTGKTLAPLYEKAMSDAIAKAQAEGITDPDEIRKRMLTAREAVKPA